MIWCSLRETVFGVRVLFQYTTKLAQKVSLADKILVQKPNLLASILVLLRMGVCMVQLEVPQHILVRHVHSDEDQQQGLSGHHIPRWPLQIPPLLASQTPPWQDGGIMTFRAW